VDVRDLIRKAHALYPDSRSLRKKWVRVRLAFPHLQARCLISSECEFDERHYRFARGMR